jgi:hypothetical protein
VVAVPLEHVESALTPSPRHRHSARPRVTAPPRQGPA